MNIAEAIFGGILVFCLIMGLFVIEPDEHPRLRIVNWVVGGIAVAVLFALSSFK